MGFRKLLYVEMGLHMGGQGSLGLKTPPLLGMGTILEDWSGIYTTEVGGNPFCLGLEKMRS